MLGGKDSAAAAQLAIKPGLNVSQKLVVDLGIVEKWPYISILDQETYVYTIYEYKDLKTTFDNHGEAIFETLSNLNAYGKQGTGQV
jgi:hypothetical protein